MWDVVVTSLNNYTFVEILRINMAKKILAIIGALIAGGLAIVTTTAPQAAHAALSMN
jgi:2-keto-3-deoxy-6-phosphogluconate aldolase